MMKRILASTAALALFALPLSAQAMQRPAGDTVTITGQVIDTYCNTVMGAAGPSHKACAEACGKAGEALAILSSDGTIYLPVSGTPGQAQNPLLLPFAEEGEGDGDAPTQSRPAHDRDQDDRRRDLRCVARRAPSCCSC